MRILAIESSCDETAVAIVSDTREILAHTVVSQLEEHRPYGGVVPEIAARSHIMHLDQLVAKTLKDAGLSYSDLDAVAATAGPGLIGGVMVGVMTAKAIASAASLPFIAVNHLEGHALTIRLTDNLPFPYLLLLVSGGHCQLLAVEDVGKYQRLGSTIDDALGEAYDKVAKMLGLGYPGGPKVEQYALKGNAKRFALPRPLLGRPDCNFSFSGLKTAVKREVDALGEGLSRRDAEDICASFQAAIGDVLNDRVARALVQFSALYPDARRFVLAGGVAANQYIRGRLESLLRDHGFTLHAPPPALCTDNAAMIGWVGVELFTRGITHDLDIGARAMWPL
ncbi:MAG: tsaD [Rickettsiales bacterium]|jgi:N6-L-threonylcarbamoyladenine synthase|nr:tsaD [Rickettsiales bacterium]